MIARMNELMKQENVVWEKMEKETIGTNYWYQLKDEFEKIANELTRLIDENKKILFIE